ncbi:MAG: acetyl-CoA carboxylase biotin carboxyl carrier protein [Planctomycetota bacterium]
MELELLSELLALMEEHGLSEMEIKEGETKIRLRKVGDEIRPEMVAANGTVRAVNPAGAAPPPANSPAPALKEEKKGVTPIVSPMVGTFYRSSSPDAEPYVTVGDEVDEETVVCIIEAMKVMNEIKAEQRGRVVEIAAENGSAVEYGQVLFRIEPVE